MRGVLSCWPVGPLALLLSSQVPAAAQSDVVGKVFCGYQGWFNCQGDGSAIDVWNHWSVFNSVPGSATLRIESFPDTTDYGRQSLFDSGFAALAGGQPARLFSSSIQATTNVHFGWIKQYGIDGVALQRFAHELRDPNFLELRNGIADNVLSSAHRFGKKFYIMYDISLLDPFDAGQSIPSWDHWVEHDWLTQVAGRGLTDSPTYARENGRPVVAIWGLGFRGKPGSPDQQRDLIEWLQQVQGCYVIGGVPRGWSDSVLADDEEPGDFSSVYAQLDMLSPWTVGGFGGTGGADAYRSTMIADMAVLAAASHRIDYQPVVFPGFAWSNWGTPAFTPNYISRERGEFMWRQFHNVKDLGIESAYVAMFDEYDEATGIGKTATDTSMIPADQYFLTTSADGEFLSSDFYLRLVGHGTAVVKGDAPNPGSLPLDEVPYTAGPIWLRTSFEGPTSSDPTAPGVDAMPDFTSSPIAIQQVGGFGTDAAARCEPTVGRARSGVNSLLVRGEDQLTNGAFVYFEVFDVDIPVKHTTRLDYGRFAENELGRHVAVDLIMDDGTTLRDSDATDQFGVSMHPGVAKGTVGAYSRTSCKIGTWLAGRRISKILVGYDEAGGTGEFAARIDNLQIVDIELKASLNR